MSRWCRYRTLLQQGCVLLLAGSLGMAQEAPVRPEPQAQSVPMQAEPGQPAGSGQPVVRGQAGPARPQPRGQQPEALQSAPSGAEAPAPVDSAPSLTSKVSSASFDLRRPTVQALYDAIARAYGIKLRYDPGLAVSHPLSDFQLEKVTLDQALSAAEDVSATFVEPLDSSTGLVAEDSAPKRAEYEPEVRASFVMDNLITAQQLTEISTALRTIVDLRRVSDDPDTNSITVVGRPRQIAVARQLLSGLQSAPGEVMLQVDLWEVDLQRASQIGLIPPQTITLQYAGPVPLSAVGLSGSFYSAILEGLTASFTFTSSIVRSHQQLSLHATDGQKARLTIGEKYPYVSTAISTDTTVSGVNTSPAALAAEGVVPGISFQDIGTVLEATPYLHADGGLTLDLDLQITGLGQTQANGEPEFTNREVSGRVQLQDGEPCLLAGFLDHTLSDTLNGYPFLARLPVVGWLFGQRNPQKNQTELLVLIRPFTIRPSIADQFASRAIFFGTELKGLAAAPVSAAGQAPGAVSQPGRPPGPPRPGGEPQPGQQPGEPAQPGMPSQPGQPAVPPTPGAAPQPGATPQPEPPQTQPSGVPPGGIQVQPAPFIPSVPQPPQGP